MLQSLIEEFFRLPHKRRAVRWRSYYTSEIPWNRMLQVHVQPERIRSG